jgi:hypothetical protein
MLQILIFFIARKRTSIVLISSGISLLTVVSLVLPEDISGILNLTDILELLTLLTWIITKILISVRSLDTTTTTFFLEET